VIEEPDEADGDRVLGLLVEASGKDRLWMPLISPSIPPTLAELAVFRWQPIVDASRKLSARSRSRLAAGDARSAWEDARAVIRIGRLAGQDRIPLSRLAGSALEVEGLETAFEILRSGKADGETEVTMLADLASLPGERPIAEIIRIQRLWMLEIETSPGVQIPDPGLEEINDWFDRYEAAWGMPPGSARIAAVEGFDREIRESALVKMSFFRRIVLGPTVRRDRAVRKESRTLVRLVTEKLSRTLLRCDVDPAARRVLARAGLALHGEKARTGSYPESLAEILPEVPLDPWSGRPVGYRREGAGCVLWSLGMDRKDGGAMAPGDIVLRLE